jgi:hypothetical protein
LGAGGLAEHEYKKHEEAGATGYPSNTGSSTTGPLSTLGQTSQNTGSGAPTSGYEAFGQQAPTTGATEHHYGRDAGVGAGALGAGGLAAREHNKQENTPTTTGTSQPGAYSSTEPSSTTTGTSKDHHYGRDAAVAGGVGGAAYEADKHHKDSKAEKAAEKEQKHEAKAAGTEHKHHGFLSFLHRDKSKKYTKEEEDEFERQEKEHNSHTGGNTVVGAGAGSAAGYEAEKYHQADTNKGLPGTPSDDAASTTAIRHGQAGDSALGTGIPKSEATTDQYGNPVGQSSGSSQVGRDAALGGLGGAGVGYGVGGINEQKGLESQGLGQHDSSYESGSTSRNRLHKDPPSGHPAAQQYSSGEGHVPANGSQREGLVSEGKNAIDNNTGVSGSHSTTGNNY